MAIVDYEGVVQDVLGKIREKASHGQRELTDFITDSIVRHRQEEGLAEKAMRLYGDELHEALVRRPATETPAGHIGNGRTTVPS